MIDTTKAFWTPRETAEYLGLSEAAVRQMVASKALACYRVGPNAGRIRIRPEDVRAYLEGHRSGPKPPAEPTPVRRRLPAIEFDHDGPDGWRKAGR